MGYNKLVSIIMPVYNAMPYLKQAVRSIYAQTIINWELIAIDDFSTDGSWEYLRKIDDPRVHIFRNEKNMRNSYTCNRATSLATGEYIAKMDADDLMLPNRLEKQVAMLEGNRNLDVVGCGLFRMQDDGRVTITHRPPQDHIDITRLFLGSMSFVHGPNFQITDGTLVGHTQWFQRWKYDSSIPYAQDFDLICRSRSTSVFGNVSEPLYIYRIGSGVTSSWGSQTKAVYYKSRSIARHAINRGKMFDAILGLSTLVTRPMAYAAVKLLVHRDGVVNKLLVSKVPLEDTKTLEKGLKQIASVDVPLKNIT